MPVLSEKNDTTNDPFVLTLKIHLYPSSEQALAFDEMCERYRQACNYVSQWIFEHDFLLNAMKVHHYVYNDLRDKFGLKAQLAIAVPRTVTARYKTVQAQLQKQPYRYQDENGNWQRIYRDLFWLQKPLVFHRPQADLDRGRAYSFVKPTEKEKESLSYKGKTPEALISLMTLDGRAKMGFSMKGFESYLNKDWKFGMGKLVKANNKWYLHMSVTKITNPPAFDRTQATGVVGIDRGLRQIMTTYDSQGKTLFFSGKQVGKKRERYRKLRQSLQTRNTKASKRRLRKLGQKENRWMSDVNHQLSKTLSCYYPSGTVFAMEDLTNVSFDEKNLNRKKSQNADLRSWSFYQLEQFLSYKARLKGQKVVSVAAQYTSQRCPICGKIEKSQRHHEMHEYRCTCGYISNDDRVAAMNIQLLGTQWVSGLSERPKFEKVHPTA